MIAAAEILAETKVVLVVDWPSRDVPDSLVRAGFTVIVHGGPGPRDYRRYELNGNDVVAGPAGPCPARADLIYSHRPMSELSTIAALARTMGAKGVWSQSGLDADGSKDPKGCWLPEAELLQARHIVEAAGLQYLAAPYIADVVRQLNSDS
jgi:predicted CoA-binding protein